MNFNKTSIDDLRENMLKAINNNDKHALNENFTEYIQLIGFALLSGDIFYGQFASNLEKIIDYNIKQAFSVSLKKDVIILHCNPMLVAVHTHKEVIALLKHEMLHLMNMHILRKEEITGRYDDEVINMAADCSVNQFIENLPPYMASYESFCDTFNLKRETTERKESLEYYCEKAAAKGNANNNAMNNHKQKNSQLSDLIKMMEDGSNNKPSDNNKSGNNGSGNDQPLSQQLKDLMDDYKGINPIDHDSWKESDNADIQNMENSIKALANECARKCRGNIPSEVQQLLNYMNQPPIIKWQDEFRKIAGSVKFPYKTTMLRRPRRSPKRYDLKGKISDRKVRIAIALDTSGSVGEKELNFIFTEIFNIVKTINFELTVIECDAEIQRVYTANSIKDIDLTVQGRGGTYFTPVFRYIKEEMSNSEKPDLLVFFTDGYGEYEIDPKYKPSGYQVIWVLTGNSKELSVKNPFTNKIRELDMYGKNKTRTRKF
jgi:predicted metal-dependent peptidase